MGKWLPRDFLVLISVATFLLERFFVSPADSYNCNCAQRHPQTMFCESEFVILANVYNSTGELYPSYSTMFNSGVHRFLRFKVKVKRVYRGAHAIKSGANIHVYTTFDRPLCAAVVSRSGLYVFSGFFTRGKASISKCTMVMYYPTMQIRSRRMLRKYGRTCNTCKITQCGGKHQCRERRYYLRRNQIRDTCLLDAISQSKTCYFDYAFCRHKRGRCRWGKAKRHFKTCKNDYRAQENR